MSNLKYILSPCGTSLLTNQAEADIKNLIFKNANKQKKEDIPKEERTKLETFLNQFEQKIKDADIVAAKKLSAELNGILSIYSDSIPNDGDYLVLLSTDTWLGEETAKLVEKWLKNKNPKAIVEIIKQKDLQTEDLQPFQLALSDLVKRLAKDLKNYSDNNYRVIFNLTGGFKSVQGFLQSISHFYADETVYIFQTSGQLMRIPRLPIKLDAAELVQKHLDYFRAIKIYQSNKNPIPSPDLEILLLTIEGETVLSPWGEVVWDQVKPEIYQQSFLSSPTPEKLSFSEAFTREAQKLSADKLLHINERIDQLCKYLFDKTNPKTLDFKKLKGKPKSVSTHEIDAWADLDAKRLYGHFEGDCFIIDELGKHL